MARIFLWPVDGSEFNGLCKSFIKYYVATDERSSASHWLEMLERCSPDDLNLPTLRRQIAHKAQGRDLVPLFGNGDA